MNRQKLLAITSIVCGIFGTWLIWYDSQNSIEAISILLGKVADTIGYWQDNPIPSEERKAFAEELTKASRLDKTGFIILMFSFALQAISLIQNPKSNKVENPEPAEQD